MIKIKWKNKLTVCIFFVLFIIGNMNFVSYCMLGNKIDSETQENKEYKNKKCEDEEDKKMNELFLNELFFKDKTQEEDQRDDKINKFSEEDIITSIDDMLEDGSEEGEEEDKKMNYIVIIEGKKRYYYKCDEKNKDYDENYVITSLEGIREDKLRE